MSKYKYEKFIFDIRVGKRVSEESTSAFKKIEYIKSDSRTIVTTLTTTRAFHDVDQFKRILSICIKDVCVSIFLKKDQSHLVFRCSSVPRTNQQKEELIFEILDALLGTNMDIFEGCFKEEVQLRDPFAGKVIKDFLEEFGTGKRTSFKFKKNLISTLVPEHYQKIWIENKVVKALTRIYTIRYQGSFYRFGPYEITFPLDFEVGGFDLSGMYGRIKVQYHDYLKSGLVQKDVRIMTDCGGGSGMSHVHPHIESNGYCCLGNYQTPITEAYVAGDYVLVLFYMHEFLSAVWNNWFTSPLMFKYCIDHEKLFSNHRCSGCSGSPKKPIRDNKFYPNVKEYYLEAEGKDPLDQGMDPYPWIEHPELEIGGDSYITQYHEKDFDDEGFDPDGYSDCGFDREGFDRRGLDPKGYDREGYDVHGYGEDGYDREGFGSCGFDREGYGRDGYTDGGYNREGLDREGNQRPVVTEEDEFFSEDEYCTDWEEAVSA